MCVDRQISVCVVVGLPLCVPATHQLYFQETIPYTRLTFLTFFQWLFTFAFVHVFVCAVPYRLHYCSISSWMSTSYSNRRKVKQIKKKQNVSFFFYFHSQTSLLLRWWHCMNSVCSAKVLMDMENENFQSAVD